MSARRLLVTDHRTKVGQNGKNACEMVEIAQVRKYVHTKYSTYGFFLKVFKFFCEFYEKKGSYKTCQKILN